MPSTGLRALAYRLTRSLERTDIDAATYQAGQIPDVIASPSLFKGPAWSSSATWKRW